MICEICGVSETSRWRGNICNSCFCKLYRKNNIVARKNYDKSVLRRYNKAQRKAKEREIEWGLSLEDYTALCNKPCYYCNNILGKIVECGVGLDRINSDIGYQLDNVLPCCQTCNIIKSDILSVDEMKQVAILIIKLRNAA